MALLFMDSFDHYATADIPAKWTTVTNGANLLCSINATGGRRGSGSFRIVNTSAGSSINAGVLRTVAPADATCTVGCSFALSNPAAIFPASGIPLVSIRDTGTPQLTLRVNASSLTLSVYRGNSTVGTLLGTTSAAIAGGGAATYIEWKAVIHPSAGTVEVRLNGVSVLSLTGQNTRNTANTVWNSLALGPVEGSNLWVNATTATLDWDDVYVLDGSGAAPWNTFLGDVRVDARYPTAAGATTGWTPSTGANWQNVDDAAPNGDTDYNSAATAGLTDTFVVQDAPVAGAALFGVQANLSMKKSDAGTCTVAAVVRHSGTNYTAPDLSPGTAYADAVQVYQTNPGTAAQWTEAGFNAAEFGYTRTA